jgi:hypothetical protein
MMDYDKMAKESNDMLKSMIKHNWKIFALIGVVVFASVFGMIFLATQLIGG